MSYFMHVPECNGGNEGLPLCVNNVSYYIPRSESCEAIRESEQNI